MEYVYVNLFAILVKLSMGVPKLGGSTRLYTLMSNTEGPDDFSNRSLAAEAAELIYGNVSPVTASVR